MFDDKQYAVVIKFRNECLRALEYEYGLKFLAAKPNARTLRKLFVLNREPDGKTISYNFKVEFEKYSAEIIDAVYNPLSKEIAVRIYVASSRRSDMVYETISTELNDTIYDVVDSMAKRMIENIAIFKHVNTKASK